MGIIGFFMLRLITDSADPILAYVRDDPVRPELSPEFRVSGGRFLIALVRDKPEAVVCVGLCDSVPSSVSALAATNFDPTIAVFYTIWSYRRGAGGELLRSAVNEIRQRLPKVSRFVTLSPRTEMARSFHLRNGAELLRENANSINFEYKNL